MDLARPALIVSLFLVAATLWYTGQWAGRDPRSGEVAPAVAETGQIIARR